MNRLVSEEADWQRTSTATWSSRNNHRPSLDPLRLNRKNILIVCEPRWTPPREDPVTKEEQRDYLVDVGRLNPTRMLLMFTSRGSDVSSGALIHDFFADVFSGQITPVPRRKVNVTRPLQQRKRSAKSNTTPGTIPSAHRMETRSKSRRIRRSGYSGVSKARSARRKVS